MVFCIKFCLKSVLSSFYYIVIYLISFRSVQSLSNVWLCNPMDCSTPRLPCSSPTPGACSNPCPLSQWCAPSISSSVILCSPAFSLSESGSFLMSHFFTSGSHSIGGSASASVLPVNIQEWFPLGLTGLISLLSKGLSRVFSNTVVQ